MKLMVDNPNLSVIMPVGCNAKCDFCYWEPSKGLTLQRFEEVINNLPPVFEQVSITGGEPTLHPELQSYLEVAKRRFKKVVLNTNGHNLKQEHFKFVDHVNISRHHYDDELNRGVFNAPRNSIPDSEKIKELCSYGDVTLNCVVEDGFSDEAFLDNYLYYAKFMEAKVAIRKYFNNLDLLPIDTDRTLVNDHSCGACRHRTHIIDGVKTTFKYSVQETCDAIGGIYELVLQSNGDLTIDWKGEKKLTYG